MGLKATLDEGKEADWANYSPSEALAKEQEEQERDRELAELRESLDEAHRVAETQFGSFRLLICTMSVVALSRTT
jgi:hypothetical protein